MLGFVDSALYFVQDKNNFINPLLQVGSGSGSVEKITGSGSGGPKITGSDRIRSSSLILLKILQLRHVARKNRLYLLSKSERSYNYIWYILKYSIFLLYLILFQPTLKFAIFNFKKSAKYSFLHFYYREYTERNR